MMKAVGAITGIITPLGKASGRNKMMATAAVMMEAGTGMLLTKRKVSTKMTATCGTTPQLLLQNCSPLGHLDAGGRSSRVA
jgi:hypothetical protein